MTEGRASRLAEGGSLISDEARGWIGREYPPCEVEVTAQDIRKYSHAIGETNPIYFDREAARKAGHRDVVAPPTFYLAVQCSCQFVMPTDQLKADGTAEEDFPPLPLTRVRAGEVRLEFSDNIVAGDVIRVRRRLTDMYEKTGRSGPLIFIEFEYRFERDGTPIIIENYTRILS